MRLREGLAWLFISLLFDSNLLTHRIGLVSFRTWHQAYVAEAFAKFEVFFLHHSKFQITNFYYLLLISTLLSSWEI